MKNTLYYGDCLEVMQQYLPNGSVDLIYLDPPFNSNRSYHMLYKNRTGYPVPEQVTAFWDTWEWNADKQDLLDRMPSVLKQYRDLDVHFVEFWLHWIRALKSTHRQMCAYLMYMFIRLLEMKRVLKSTGSLYLHCDPTASHYIKVMMDGLFGRDHFRNEIVWCYTQGGRPQKDFPRKHDIVFRYTKSKTYHFSATDIKIDREAFSEKTSSPFHRTDKDGRKFYIKTVNNKEYTYYEDEGKTPYDWWIDIPKMTGHYAKMKSGDYLGYRTQKPIKLLDRIIKASCPEAGVVFDPFCGCGTTIYASHLLGRRWIGCDITIHATNLIDETLQNRYQLTADRDYEVRGIPTSVASAQKLMDDNPFEFEKWAVEYVHGFCSKKTTDKGIDGKIYFEAEDKSLHHMVLSVKGGKNLNPGMVRDLGGTMNREGSQMGGLILLNEPTKGMLQEVQEAGNVHYFGKAYPTMQIVTVKQMIDEEKRFHLPSVIGHKEKTDEVYFTPEIKATAKGWKPLR